MAEYSVYQRGAGQTFYPQHATNIRTLPSRVRSPTTSTARIPFSNPDTPSPSRSPGRQQSPQQFGMFNQQHGHQAQHVLMNGRNSHQNYAMQMNLAGKTFQHSQSHQHHGQHHQQHQDHAGGAHGAQYNHQHNLSSGNMSNAQPHFGQAHMQNGTPNSVHSGLSKPPNEHWAEQLRLAQTAREMTQSHSHARIHPSVSKSVVAGTGSGLSKEPDKEERNRPAVGGAADGKGDHIWTILDFGGQNLKVITPALFNHYTFLTKLYVNCNKLSYIPQSIGQLRNLTHLDLSLNNLQFLPPEIGMLVNLKQLLLFDNHLDNLPYELGSLFQLEMLGIEGNPLPDDLKQIVMEQGTTELIKHFRENSQGPEAPSERDWIVLDEIQDPDQETVTALSYNILCDKYCTQAQYGYTPSAALSWENRRETILGELRERNADIVCLQEIDQDSFNEYFREGLAHNDYKGVFWPKSRARTMADREAKLVDGCAIFYKNSKYILLDKQLIDFANTAINRPDMKGEHDIFNRVMPRDDIAVVAFLENRATGSRFIVGNVHVFWNPAFTDVKLVQVAILLEGIKNFANRWAKFPACKDKVVYRFTNGDTEDGKEPDPTQEPGPSKEYSDGTQIPLILCGDFNSLPTSGIYDLITTGSMSNVHDDLGSRKYGNFTRDGISHPFSLKSSYSSIGELSFTNYTPSFVGVLDYIWYSTNTLQVVGLLGDIDKNYLQRVPGFPNYHFPSDHIALYAQYIVKGRKEAKKVSEVDFGPSSNRDRRN